MPMLYQISMFKKNQYFNIVFKIHVFFFRSESCYGEHKEAGSRDETATNLGFGSSLNKVFTALLSPGRSTLGCF